MRLGLSTLVRSIPGPDARVPNCPSLKLAVRLVAQMPFRQVLRTRPNQLLKCRLCGRIAVVVCLSILMTELAILVPSYLRLKSSQYEELATEGKFALSLALSELSHHSLDEVIRQRRAAFERAKIKGAAIYDESGALLKSFGEPPVLVPHESAAAPAASGMTADDARYEMIWPTFAESEPVTIVLPSIWAATSRTSAVRKRS